MNRIYTTDELDVIIEALDEAIKAIPAKIRTAIELGVYKNTDNEAIENIAESVNKLWTKKETLTALKEDFDEELDNMLSKE